ncbi:MAG: sulfotransferase [Desulfobulbaceae bacterium]|nr:sulfotransferase [Desulfobulbaceae bacterium]
MDKRAFKLFESLNMSPALNLSLVVTGMPRGGTTLLGYMINHLENAYCLSEPMGVEEHQLQVASSDEFLDKIRSFFNEQRELILSTGRCVNRVDKNGMPVTNYFKRTGNKSIEHTSQLTEEAVRVRDEGFLLAIKHNAHFLSILPLLCSAPDISVLALVRHPIPTILSWRSLDIPISHGRLPSGEKFWPELADIASSDRENLLKQVMIYELIVSRIMNCRKQINLLCYENLIKHPEQLCAVLGYQFQTPVKFNSCNKNKDYNWGEVQEVKALLRRNAPNTLRIYPDLDNPESSMEI